MWLSREGLIKGGNAAFVYNPYGPLIKGTNGRFAPSRGIADGSAIFYYKPSGIYPGGFFHISLCFKFVVTSLWAYKWFNLKQTLVANYVMTGLTGHLNLLGWCDCNILLLGFIWVVLRSYGGG